MCHVRSDYVCNTQKINIRIVDWNTTKNSNQTESTICVYDDKKRKYLA
jgi:hypothetical protein